MSDNFNTKLPSDLFTKSQKVNLKRISFQHLAAFDEYLEDLLANGISLPKAVLVDRSTFFRLRQMVRAHKRLEPSPVPHSTFIIDGIVVTWDEKYEGLQTKI